MCFLKQSKQRTVVYVHKAGICMYLDKQPPLMLDLEEGMQTFPVKMKQHCPQGVTSLSSDHFCRVFQKQVLFICMHVHVYISEVHMLARRQHSSKSRWPVLSDQTIPAWQIARPKLNGINIRYSIFPEMCWEIVCFRIYQASFRLGHWSLGSTVSQVIEKSIRLL